MKAKLSIAALAVFLASCAVAQEVRFARVVSVTPVEGVEQVSEPRNVCTKVQVPIYRDVPVQVLVETPVVSHVQTNPGMPLVGMVIGAAVGNRAFSGDARIAGTLLGAAVGTAIGENASRHTYVTTHPTYVTQYRREVRAVRYRDECAIVYEPVYRSVVTGYNVAYSLDGVIRNVVMNSRPGDYVKVVTSTMVEP